jgi:preprotein translocase subunit SecF
MDVTIGSQFDNKDVEDIVKEVTGENAPQVQKVGDGTSVAIKTKSLDNSTRSQLQSKLEEKYNITESEFTIQDVSATISKDMVRDSIKSVVVAYLCLYT